MLYLGPGAGVSNFFVNGGMRSMGILLVEFVIRFKAESFVVAVALGFVAAGFAIFGTNFTLFYTYMLFCLLLSVQVNFLHSYVKKVYKS